MEAPGFWDNPENSQKAMKELKHLKDAVEKYETLETAYEDVETLIEMGYEENDESLISEIEEALNLFIEELEELLVMGDVGVNTAGFICDQLRGKIKEKGITDPSLILGELKAIVSDMLQGDNELHISTKPSIILVIGVNGVGKTTTIGKLASRLKGEGKSVILGAADTFRAAAIEQLEVWADRAGVPLIKHKEGADPAAVVFDTIAAAKARGCDVIICDTAGRLHNKKNLMDELGKISRVIDRELPGCDRETLLVLDAATGQNAVNQAREFQSAAGITGIVLTKLDGTPKGGVVLPIMQDLGLPVKFIGVGEQVDDLQPFDPDAFADALFDVQREEAPVLKEDRDVWEGEQHQEEEKILEEQSQAQEEALAGEALLEQLEEQPPTEESLLADIDAMLEETQAEESQEEPQEEPQPEKKKRRFWPFGRKRDEE